MPNWTANELYITFPNKEEKEKFASIAKQDERIFSFNGFIPMPEGLIETTSPHQTPEDFVARVNQRNHTNYQNLTDVMNSRNQWDADIAKGIAMNMEFHRKIGYYNWYDWSISNWGTKWDACHSSLIGETDTSLSYTFDTAWDTPMVFFNTLFNMYPDLEFRVVSHSIESDYYFEIVKEDGEYIVTEEYDSFREAIKNGKLGGEEEWQDFFEDDEEEVEIA